MASLTREKAITHVETIRNRAKRRPDKSSFLI